MRSWAPGGSGADLDLIAPAMAADDNVRRWYAQVQHLPASPATAAAMARQWYEVDVRSVLPASQAPTPVIARAGNAIEEFVTGMRPLPSPDRFLGTVLFVDVAGPVIASRSGSRLGDAS
jgi:hypothetical protein